MRRWPIALITGLLLAGSSGFASPADLYVVCNLDVSLDKSDVRDLFLGARHFADSVKLDPVDNAAAQTEFLERVLLMDRVKYTRLWIKKSFRDGINPPQVMASDAEVLAYVKRTSGGCGYLATAPGPVVAVIGKF